MSGNALPNTGNNPVIINEYGWLWLNRDGTPTTLSKKNYEQLLGPNATADQRRELYARLLAAKTEFWRARRHVAGVLHFCGLGYSRPDGQTSDHFLDIESLALEPHFRTYVGDAFSPVGLMVDHWADEVRPGETRRVPVVVMNDLYSEWQGTVRLQLVHGGGAALRAVAAVLRGRRSARRRSVRGPGPGRARAAISLLAELVGPGAASGAEPAGLRRPDRGRAPGREGLAKGKPVKASSSVTVGGENYPAAAAVDGDPSTRWSSEFSDPQWIAVDLGGPTKISRVELAWEAAYGKAYAIQVSLDGENLEGRYTTSPARAGLETIRFAPVEARWVRMYGTKRGTPFGYSLWEFKVFP